MDGCYVGRGTLLVSLLGTSRGFFPFSGQAEVNLRFQEDNESVNDARHGVNERVDWFVRNYRVTLESECFDIGPNAIEQLMKTNTVTHFGGPSSYTTAGSSISIDEPYFVKHPLIFNVVVRDFNSTVIPVNYYSLADARFGLVTFVGDHIAGGFTAPYTIFFSYGDYTAYVFSTRSSILMQAFFRGYNKVTGKEVMAHFYRLTLDIGEQLKLTQKPFSGINVRLQATPDVAAALDPLLGQYGRIILL